MDGSIISGTRILKGEEVFRFAWNPLSKDDKKSDCGSNEDYHFFLNILDFNDKRKTRSRKASGSIVPEEGEKIYCSFCHKLDTECTCFVIYAKCDTCGEKLNDCACSKNETCDICHQTKKDGKCGCCLVCHDYPCICGRDPNDKPETEQGGKQQTRWRGRNDNQRRGFLARRRRGSERQHHKSVGSKDHRGGTSRRPAGDKASGEHDFGGMQLRSSGNVQGTLRLSATRDECPGE